MLYVLLFLCFQSLKSVIISLLAPTVHHVQPDYISFFHSIYGFRHFLAGFGPCSGNEVLLSQSSRSEMSGLSTKYLERLLQLLLCHNTAQVRSGANPDRD